MRLLTVSIIFVLATSHSIHSKQPVHKDETGDKKTWDSNAGIPQSTPNPATSAAPVGTPSPDPKKRQGDGDANPKRYQVDIISQPITKENRWVVFSAILSAVGIFTNIAIFLFII